MESQIKDAIDDLDIVKHEVITAVGIRVDRLIRDASVCLCKDQAHSLEYRRILTSLENYKEILCWLLKKVLHSEASQVTVRNGDMPPPPPRSGFWGKVSKKSATKLEDEQRHLWRKKTAIPRSSKLPSPMARSTREIPRRNGIIQNRVFPNRRSPPTDAFKSGSSYRWLPQPPMHDSNLCTDLSVPSKRMKQNIVIPFGSNHDKIISAVTRKSPAKTSIQMARNGTAIHMGFKSRRRSPCTSMDASKSSNCNITALQSRKSFYRATITRVSKRLGHIISNDNFCVMHFFKLTREIIPRDLQITGFPVVFPINDIEKVFKREFATEKCIANLIEKKLAEMSLPSKTITGKQSGNRTLDVSEENRAMTTGCDPIPAHLERTQSKPCLPRGQASRSHEMQREEDPERDANANVGERIESERHGPTNHTVHGSDQCLNGLPINKHTQGHDFCTDGPGLSEDSGPACTLFFSNLNEENPSTESSLEWVVSTSRKENPPVTPLTQMQLHAPVTTMPGPHLPGTQKSSHPKEENCSGTFSSEYIIYPPKKGNSSATLSPDGHLHIPSNNRLASIECHDTMQFSNLKEDNPSAPLTPDIIVFPRGEETPSVTHNPPTSVPNSFSHVPIIVLQDADTQTTYLRDDRTSTKASAQTHVSPPTKSSPSGTHPPGRCRPTIYTPVHDAMMTDCHQPATRLFNLRRDNVLQQSSPECLTISPQISSSPVVPLGNLCKDYAATNNCVVSIMCQNASELATLMEENPSQVSSPRSPYSPLGELNPSLSPSPKDYLSNGFNPTASTMRHYAPQFSNALETKHTAPLCPEMQVVTLNECMSQHRPLQECIFCFP